MAEKRIERVVGGGYGQSATATTAQSKNSAERRLFRPMTRASNHTTTCTMRPPTQTSRPKAIQWT